FAFECTPDLPRYAHTFATFVKATGVGPCASQYAIEAHTISWCPASGVIRLARLCPERGVNRDLTGTLAWAPWLGAWISRWGPFQIRKELYDRAVAQECRLASGAIGYKVLDCGVRPGCASNCIHAVSDIVEGPLLQTGTAYGDEAGAMVAHHFLP